MRTILIDSAGWIAVEDPDDQYHRIAVDARDRTLKQYRWITTNWIVWETVTWLRRHIGHQRAVQFGERMRTTKAVELITVTAELETRAWEIFKHYRDKDFGFVDCTSFAVMQELGLNTAFTFDEHFRQMGFTTLPGAPPGIREPGAGYSTGAVTVALSGAHLG